MSTRSSLGWQTMLADLSLILFMVTAAAMAENPATPPHAAGHSHAKPASEPIAQPTPRGALADPARAEPIAVWRAGPMAPPLAQWLAAQQPDPRQQLTLTIRHAPGAQADALTRAAELAREAGRAGRDARVILEPATDSAARGVYAVLAYDRPSVPLASASAQLARPLR
ncbi:MAG TPA: hypothetical protein VN222_14525 [Novosphingobium sp.]|nr:hypothetical protein [Novosphingobium sp.]